MKSNTKFAIGDEVQHARYGVGVVYQTSFKHRPAPTVPHCAVAFAREFGDRWIPDEELTATGRKLAPFRVERQHMVPVYQHLVIHAETAEAAMREAMDEERHGWEGSVVDYESSRPHYIVSCHEGDGTDPDAPSVPVPVDIAEPAAEDMPLALQEILTAGRQMLDAFGGDVPDWVTPEFARLEIVVMALERRELPSFQPRQPEGN